jgi:glucosamine kinase
MDALIVGVDAGATSTRCLAATLDGTVLARAESGGANQNSSGGRPGETFTALLRSALSDVDTPALVAGVFAIAGSGGKGRPRAQAAADEAWAALELPGSPAVVLDLEAAYAAGTASPDGALLLAGTGAISGRFKDHSLVRRCDGYGWLAGDEGSAVWVGREALRSVFRALDGRGPATALTGSVTSLLVGAFEGTREEQVQALIAASFEVPPAALGRLAPLVQRAAGDPVADRVIADAAGHLLHSLDTVSEGEREIVLAGGLLLADGPIGDAVRAGVRQRFGTEPHDALDGAAGAAALAIARLTGAPATPAVHRTLTAHQRR